MRTLVRNIGELEGNEVELKGWVDGRRDHGGLIFIDLRDRSGVAQLVFNPKKFPEVHKVAETLRTAFVISVKGEVKKRPQGMENPKVPSGSYEISVSVLEVINEAETPPIATDGDGYDIGEESRMKYRYLDLRRPRMSDNLRLRHKVIKFMRDFLDSREFVEIETPLLTKTTPEGARDFVVPARLHPGNFYALPQSPQQYKQLLMVSGFENYYQIARCFRDEDSRADRAYGEFTQLDVEMSFVGQEDILRLAEELFTELVGKLFPEKKITQSPWPRISHKEAKEKYGSDKPDLRKNKEDKNELAFAWVLDFPLFTEQSQEDYFHGSGAAKFAPSHHMFTAPHPDDVSLLESDPTKVRGLQHDMVLNGVEVGGGSIRIHNRKVQEKVFDLIGFSKAQKEQFRHMLQAFEYGVPPHGGIAPGVDRFLFTALGEPSLREVLAFPKTGDGRDLMMDAPSEVDKGQLDELNLEVKKPKK